MQAAFTFPFMYWVGMTTPPGTDPAAVEAFSQFYSHTHVPEVIANNPGFVRATRYELVSQDPRGELGPGWLAMYELDSEVAARNYMQRNDGPADGRPTYTAGPPAWKAARRGWRLMWRRVSSTGPAAELPHAIYMVGMNVPDGTDDAGLAEFNAFYTSTHVPEVIHNGDYARGTRFELERDFNAAEPGCPRFCAIYEADETATELLLGRRSGASARPLKRPYSEGPEVWQKHDTLWRLVYRRVSPDQP